jgi:hypothetical protein
VVGASQDWRMRRAATTRRRKWPFMRDTAPASGLPASRGVSAPHDGAMRPAEKGLTIAVPTRAEWDTILARFGKRRTGVRRHG